MSFTFLSVPWLCLSWWCSVSYIASVWVLLGNSKEIQTVLWINLTGVCIKPKAVARARLFFSFPFGRWSILCFSLGHSQWQCKCQASMTQTVLSFPFCHWLVSINDCNADNICVFKLYLTSFFLQPHTLIVYTIRSTFNFRLNWQKHSVFV